MASSAAGVLKKHRIAFAGELSGHIAWLLLVKEKAFTLISLPGSNMADLGEERRGLVGQQLAAQRVSPASCTVPCSPGFGRHLEW